MKKTTRQPKRIKLWVNEYYSGYGVAHGSRSQDDDLVTRAEIRAALRKVGVR